MDTKLKKQLDDFILILTKDLKKKYSKKQFNLSNKNFVNFTNYITKKLQPLHINYNIEYIYENLYKKLNSKNINRFNNIKTIINRVIYDKETQTSHKKNIQVLKKKLPKLKVYEQCDKVEYKTMDIIGKGSFGTVFSLRNHPDKIVKTIDITNYNISVEFDYNSLNMLVSEILIMDKLNNTDISPKLYDYFICSSEDKLILCLIQEKMDSSLRDWIQKGNTLNDSHKIQLIKKTKQLHKLGILHKDIHDGNILVNTIDNKVNLYLADFGISKTFENMINNLKKKDLDNIEELFYYKGYYLNKIIICFIIILNISIII